MTRKTAGRALFVTMALVVSLAALGGSSATATPTGEYAGFVECPLSAELNGCVASRMESGGITIGKQTVPIVKKLTLQAGFFEDKSGVFEFVSAVNGNTLSKTPQKVPGGLSGLLKCSEIGSFPERAACEGSFANGATGVTATPELAVPASSVSMNGDNVLNQHGVGLSLPLKVKLENPFLGNACYVGSNAHPLTLGLTDGITNPPPPNTPIKGWLGKVTTKGEGRILVISGASFVDNSFAAAGATGCGGSFSFLIDPIIDSKIGLPSPAGKNTAIFNVTIEQAGIEAVREHDR